MRAQCLNLISVATLAWFALLTTGCSLLLNADVGPNDTIPECSSDSDCIGENNLCMLSQNTCYDVTSTPSPCETGDNVVLVSETIEENRTWESNICYQLQGPVFVRNEATLTIRAGTQIQGLAQGSALIVTRNSRLEVLGTAQAPVVFTSAQAEGSRQPGDWGGVALLGQAPLDVGEDSLEGLSANEDTLYGGTNTEHNCGKLQYMRVEFSGFEFGNNNELNGLTLAGCGSETQVEYVQVHYGRDDGIEIFGGSVGLNNIVISRAQDDSLDWDQGWRGWAQFVTIIQDAPRTDDGENIYKGGENAIEADGYDGPDTTRRSRPLLYNFTMVGSFDGGRSRALKLADGTSFNIRNFLVLNYPNGFMDIVVDTENGNGLNTPTSDCLNQTDTCSSSDYAIIDGLVLYNIGPDGQTWALAEDENDPDDFDETAYLDILNLDSNVQFLVGEINLLSQPDINLPALDLQPTSTSVVNLISPTSYSGRPEQVQDFGSSFIGSIPPEGVNWMNTGWTAYPDN